MYIKKLVSLPEEVAEQLQKEGNMSAVVTEALSKHYAGRDASRGLIALAQTIGTTLDELDESVDLVAKQVRAIAIFMNSQGANVPLR